MNNQVNTCVAQPSVKLSLKMGMQPQELRAELERNFPLDAQSWADATDEVRDLSRLAREARYQPSRIMLDFRQLNTPSDWNTKGINNILTHYEAMTEAQRTSFMEQALEHFPNTEWEYQLGSTLFKAIDGVICGPNAEGEYTNKYPTYLFSDEDEFQAQCVFIFTYVW